MSKVLDRLSRLVTARPYITLLILLIVTVVMAAGGSLRIPPTEGADVAFLPPGHPIAIDRRRESRGTLRPARPISNALPGISQLAEKLGRSVTRWPVPYLVVIIAVTVGLGFIGTGLKSAFSIKDILPRGGMGYGSGALALS